MGKILQYINGFTIILFKILILPDYVLLIFLPFLLKIFCKNYNMLSLYWHGKEIKQNFNFKALKYRKIDYFKEKQKVKNLLEEEYIKSFKILSEKQKGKTVIFVTNSWIKKHVLDALQADEIIKYKEIKKSKRLIPQTTEKLVLMSNLFILKNIFNKTLWKQIFKNEEVHTYEIVLKGVSKCY